jgi:catechol 2,3-dioxygenase-like lactoylglutathione lyase family enzyme
MQLNHVTIPAGDVGAALAFYRALGFRLIVDAAPRYVRLEAPEGEQTLSIERPEGPETGGGPVLFLECNDLDATVSRLEAAGIAFDSPPTDRPWLWREARLRDPAGNSLCLYSAGENRRFPPWRVG